MPIKPMLKKTRKLLIIG